MEFVIDTARSMEEVLTRDIKKVPALRGKTVVNLFFEASTRTRTSFEIAGKRLSADVVNFSSGTSSVTKGETLLDTARNIEAMKPNILVVRHSASGAALFLSRHLSCSIINAGDGANEHPSQGLLDLLHDPEGEGEDRRPEDRHRGGYPAQPGRPVGPSLPREDGGETVAVRTGDPRSPGDGADRGGRDERHS